MTYHKRSAVKRKCAHCDATFKSNHKSRLYCCQSCNTLAWRARHGHTGAAKPPAPATGAALAFSAQTIGVVTLGAALGSLAAQGGTYVAQQLFQGGSGLELLQTQVHQLHQHLGLAAAPPPAARGAGFLPAALRAATAPRVPIRVGDRRVPFVRLDYHGHVLYHDPEQGLVLWEEQPGQCHRVHSEQQLAALAATPPGAPALPVVIPLAEELFGAKFLADIAQQAAQEAADSARWKAAFDSVLATDSEASSPPAGTDAPATLSAG